MSNLFKTNFLLLLSFIALLSCNKEDLSVNTNSEKEELQASFRNSTQNPYDYIGVEHNNLLDDYYQLQYPDKNNEILLDFLSENVNFQYFPASFPAFDIIGDKSTNVRSFLAAQTSIPNEVKLYSLEMLDAIDDNNQLSLLNLEEQVLEDSNLDDGEKEALLIGISVAKYSLDYWEDNVSNWVPNDDGIMEAANYAAIDAATAYFTAVSCNLGYLSPPTGVTVTAFALATGATASIAAAAADGLTYVYDTIRENW